MTGVGVLTPRMLFKGGEFELRSNVEILGHPLHPIIVNVAIGAFIAAFVFDIAALATGSASWFVMSFWTLLIGACAGVFAVLSGFYDYVTLRMSRPARNVATIHLSLNLAFMLLFIASLILKGMAAASGPLLVPYGRIVSTFVLDVIGIVILVASGWFGGELIFKHGIAVTEEAAAEICPAVGTAPAMGTTGGEAQFDLPPHEDNPSDE